MERQETPCAGPVDETLLSPTERMLLCQRRVEFILEGTADEPDRFDEIQFPPALAISEIETVLREMKGILVRGGRKDRFG